MDRVVSHIGVEDSDERGMKRKKFIETLQSNGYPVSFIRDVERKKLRKMQEAYIL